MALITVFMVLMVASALMVGFFATIIADQRANGIDRDQTQSYAAAHAGLEKLTSDMATLFVTDYSPAKWQIDRIIAKPPVIPGFQFTAPGGVAGSGYLVTYKSETTPGPNFGNPVPDLTTGTPITAGPYSGFKGIITKYPITVTARSKGGAEVRLRRELQTVAVPVFQFGVFSETDLTFYAGDNFDFGGRVQTNGNLFLSELSGFTLTLSDRVTAFKEVVRNNLSNGTPVANVTFTGTVNVLDVTSGIHYRPLATNEGSVTGMPTSTVPPFTQTLNTNWTTISTGGAFYKSIIRNGLTGAKYLSLPLVSQGAQPIDLIKRPPVTPVDPALAENLTNPLVFGQRYFSLGYPDSGPSLRILLSDTAQEILRLPTVTNTAPVPLDGTATGLGRYAAATNVGQHVSPMATSPGYWNAPLNLYRMTSTASVYAPPAASTVTIGAGIPAYFKIPLNIVVSGVNRVCTGRTLTTFTGCLPVPGAAIPVGTAVTAVVPSGAGTINVSTTLTANWNAGGTITVASTAAFAPGVFWLSTAGNLIDGGAFTCSGYTAANVLTGCSGLAAAVPNGTFISTGSMENAGAPLNRGFIKIEMRNNATPGAWEDVTTEILNLGISGPPNNGPACDPTPNAVIRLQHLRDHDGGLCSTVGTVGNASLNSNDYWPNALYDTREGTLRDNDKLITDRRINHGGVMNYVALDVRNLTRWLSGAIGASGNRALSQNGYIVYFSDRRNNKCTPGAPAPNNSCADIPALGAAGTPVETGEFGFEDNVNPGTTDGIPVAPRVLDVGEDVNAFTPLAGQPAYVPVQDIYGITPPVAAVASFNNPAAPLPAGMKDALAFPWTGTNLQWVGMINRPVLFRRALKLINGGSNVGPPVVSNLPAPGLTVASENPVYVQGNYNATVGTAAGVTATEIHNAAAILADSITLLSSAWNDGLSFQWPNDAVQRPAVSTAYRFAAVSGKGLSFPYAGVGGAPQFLFGTDGGVGNFLRLLEDWLPGTTAIRYRGSIVSLFVSRQATGLFKFNNPPRVYQYGLRTFVFDNDFLLPALLPPGTPMFRDVNTLTFRQLLRPNQ